MATALLAMVAVAAVVAGAAGGTVLYTDLQDFELEIDVSDALTGEAISGASVDIRDANGVLIASGTTDDDGEYELEVDDEDAEDSDDEDDEDLEEIESEENASLGAIAGPLSVTVSKTGYTAQTFTVDIDTLDDEDIEVELVPTA